MAVVVRAKKPDRRSSVKAEYVKPPFQGRTFVEKFFKSDRLAMEALTLLKPQYRQQDLVTVHPMDVGPKMVEIGESLSEVGSFPGGHYIHEHSLEFKESIDLLRKSLKEVSSHEFVKLIDRSAKKAKDGYHLLGTFGSRLAALRWMCAMWWMAARAMVVGAVSGGSGFGTISPQASADACRNAKEAMFEWIRSFIHEAPVLKIYDFDLVGYGVYMNKRAEPMPRGADNEYLRRQLECDIGRLCYQVNQLPPEDLNDAAPFLPILRPYGELTWELVPPKAMRSIIERHEWTCEVRSPPLDEMPRKALVEGPVMHIDKPPEPEFDIEDPEIIAKIQRGEDLGKGHQEDGLPGALHGSIGLLFAAIAGDEELENVCINPGILEIEGFLESFLKYSTPLKTLDLSYAGEVMTGLAGEDILLTLPFAGPSLQCLDLAGCCLNGDHVDTLAEVLEQLPGLKHVDLSHNALDAEAARTLLAALAEKRVDLESLRMDDNPLGDMHAFTQEVASVLAHRGEQVVAGGELVLHNELNGVRWYPHPRNGTLAAIRRDDTKPLCATSFDELLQDAEYRNAYLDDLFAEGKDKRTKTAVGKVILAEKRAYNDSVLNDKLLGAWVESEKIAANGGVPIVEERRPEDDDKGYVWRVSKDRRTIEVAFPIPDRSERRDIIYRLSKEEDPEQPQILKLGYVQRAHAIAARNEIILVHGRLTKRVIREKCSFEIEEFPSTKICVLTLTRPSILKYEHEPFLYQAFEEALGEQAGEPSSPNSFARIA